jgi:hypothetical protein
VYCSCWLPSLDIYGEINSQWIKDDDVISCVAHEYTMNWPMLQWLVHHCKAHGLEASIDAQRSWHFPGRTVLLEITRPPQRDQDETKQELAEDLLAPASSSAPGFAPQKKGYHQGWKDALDVMRALMNQSDKSFAGAEYLCFDYWRGPLLRWVRDDEARPESPPALPMPHKHDFA